MLAITFEQLRVLQAIVSEGSFHAAAQQLHKSQPALSHMMKKLEDEVGFTLLSREKYRPVLTSSGEIFYRKALQVLKEAHELHELSQQLNGEFEGELHLVITATCDLSPLLKVINQTRQDYPHTHIRLSIGAMGGPIENLLEGHADFVIATMDGVNSKQVIVSPYQEIKIIPVCHTDYLNTAPANTAKFDNVSGCTQIVVSDSGSGAHEQTRDLAPDTPKWTVSDFNSKKKIIKAKMGWGGMPEHLISTELESGELKPLNLDHFPIRKSQLMLMRKRDHVLGTVGQVLWQRIIDLSFS